MTNRQIVLRSRPETTPSAENFALRIVEGLEQAPEALLRLFDGRNFGKLLVRVSEDPTQAGRS